MNVRVQDKAEIILSSNDNFQINSLISISPGFQELKIHAPMLHSLEIG